MGFRVLIADPLSEEGIAPLLESDDIHLDLGTEWTNQELLERISDYDALLVRSQTQVTRDLITKATNLKIVGRAGVGVDNIDLDAATEHGIIVVNAPNGNTNSAAEHTMAMMMALSRKIPQAYLSLKNRQWDRKKYIGIELKNKTLGIIGLGRIGAEVAYRARGQRMNIIAYDPFLSEDHANKLGIKKGNIEDVYQHADFITIHTPLLKETRHLLNKQAFEAMKDGVQIINCARGGIIDEEALYEAIQAKKVAGAALDVFEEEPFYEHQLLELPEVIATPHLGASTIEAQESVAIDVSEDVIRYVHGEAVRNPVNLPSIPREALSEIEPYFLLAEKLGQFLILLADEPVEQINLYYSGDVAKTKIGPITRNAVKGLLTRHLGDHVNDVNALYLAEKRGVTIHENKTSSTQGFTNLIRVEIVTKSKKRSVAGTLLNGLGPRIVKVDHYSVDVTPKGHLLVIHHQDQPGVIGKMGSLLATKHINIATMQVDRADIGGNAIMVMTVDRHIEKNALEALKQLEEIHDAISIDL
ncbi:phosphoglycerate dehydrogenase [Virgibacillus pantothenticus]|uniref:phosphoglycerate dehydrogenase n=1 Tax=Virgibacillus pantothenticus TaxID=1473 RepID=UPI0009857802|nr:phosphoglycerate dehydrogenase [Virgibacillus pantothenticus]